MTHIWTHPSEAPPEERPTCPRCGERLFVELDPTEGLCLTHGTVAIPRASLPLVDEEEEKLW